MARLYGRRFSATIASSGAISYDGIRRRRGSVARLACKDVLPAGTSCLQGRFKEGDLPAECLICVIE